jgi:16S rRNA processing protein RimM
MPLAFDELVTIGHVVKPQGRHGEMAVEIVSENPDRFAPSRKVFVPGPYGVAREVEIESSFPHKGRMVVKLRGVDSIEVADSYRGMDLRIPEAELPALPAGSYYHYQLKGLDVVDESGRAIGRVHDLLETGAAMVLVIRDGEKETLLPLAEEFVHSVDLTAHRMTVRVPEVMNARD